MGELQSKPFQEPDEVVSLPNLVGQIVVLGETYIARYIYQPGWRWAKDVKPVVGTTSCQYHHQGVVLSGHLHVATDEGSQRTIGPGEAFDIPPGHDAWVIGDEPCDTFEFRGARGWASPTGAGERVLSTMLLTDIVGSTATATRLGDIAWKQLLARHYDRVRVEIDRFRGHEVTTTGDGLLVMFDGTARAVRCASAICQIAREDGIDVRAGVHSGEVERHPNNVEGVAVHIVARISSLAEPGEVLLSDSTVALLEGSGFSFSNAGQHALKGLPGQRWLFRLTKGDSQS